jgi:hypothetical protein
MKLLKIGFLHGIFTRASAGRSLCALRKPGPEFDPGVDLVFFLEFPDGFPPYKGGGEHMSTAAAGLRQRHTVITGHRPQGFSRKSGEQAASDLMSTEDLEGKIMSLPPSPRNFEALMHTPQERFFITAEMDDSGTRLPAAA